MRSPLDSLLRSAQIVVMDPGATATLEAMEQLLRGPMSNDAYGQVLDLIGGWYDDDPTSFEALGALRLAQRLLTHWHPSFRQAPTSWLLQQGAEHPGLSLAGSIALSTEDDAEALLATSATKRCETLLLLGVDGPGIDAALAALERAQPPRLRRLTCKDSQLGDEHVERIASSGQLAKRLERIDVLDGSALTDRGLLTLGTLPSLRSLLLLRGGGTAAGMVAMAEGAAMGQLETLILAHMTVGDVGARAIAEHGRALTRLTLDKCEIGDEGARAIARSSALAGLRWLDLPHNPYGTEAAVTVFHGLAFGPDLHLDHNTARPEQLDAAPAADSWQALLRLAAWLHDEVDEATFTADAIPFLEREIAPWPDGVRELPVELLDGERSWLSPLVRSAIFDAEPARARQLLAHPVLSQLRVLSLRTCDLDEAALEPLFAAPLAEIHTLNLAGNRIGAAAVQKLLDAPLLRSLRVLMLDENPVGDEGVAAIAGALEGSRLERVMLRRAGLGDGALIDLVSAKHPHHLEMLSLTGNDGISIVGRKMLARRCEKGHLTLIDAGSDSPALYLRGPHLENLHLREMAACDLDGGSIALPAPTLRGFGRMIADVIHALHGLRLGAFHEALSHWAMPQPEAWFDSIGRSDLLAPFLDSTRYLCFEVGAALLRACSSETIAIERIDMRHDSSEARDIARCLAGRAPLARATVWRTACFDFAYVDGAWRWLGRLDWPSDPDVDEVIHPIVEPHEPAQKVPLRPTVDAELVTKLRSLRAQIDAQNSAGEAEAAARLVDSALAAVRESPVRSLATYAELVQIADPFDWSDAMLELLATSWSDPKARAALPALAPVMRAIGEPIRSAARSLFRELVSNPDPLGLVACVHDAESALGRGERVGADMDVLTAELLSDTLYQARHRRVLALRERLDGG